MLRKIWIASILFLISGNTLAMDSFRPSIIDQRNYMHYEIHHNEVYSTYIHSQPIHNNYYRKEIQHHEVYVPRSTYIHLQPIHNNNHYRKEKQHYEQIVVHRPQRYYYSEH